MKVFKNLSRLVSIVLVLSMLCGMTVFANSEDVHFDFPKREINLAPGDEYHMYVWASDEIHNHDMYNDYSIYLVAHNPELGKSEKTYIWSDYKCGNSFVDIYIGEDEKNTGFSLYFYIDGLDYYQNVNVHIVDPTISDVESTRINANRVLCGMDPLPVDPQEKYQLVRFQ